MKKWFIVVLVSFLILCIIAGSLIIVCVEHSTKEPTNYEEPESVEEVLDIATDVEPVYTIDPNVEYADDEVSVPLYEEVEDEMSLGDYLLMQQEATGGAVIPTDETIKDITTAPVDFRYEVTGTLVETPLHLRILNHDYPDYSEEINKSMEGLKVFCDTKGFNYANAEVDYDTRWESFNTDFDYFVSIDGTTLFVGVKENTVYIKVMS